MASQPLSIHELEKIRGKSSCSLLAVIIVVDLVAVDFAVAVDVVAVVDLVVVVVAVDVKIQIMPSVQLLFHLNVVTRTIFVTSFIISPIDQQ